jgi:hypothetical protein
MKLSGRWNGALTVKGEKKGGWIFMIAKHKEVTVSANRLGLRWAQLSFNALRVDIAVIVQLLRNPYAAMQSDCEEISKRMRSDSELYANRLRSDCVPTAQRLRGD